MKNCSNCWDLPLGQSAAKPAREGSTTSRKTYTQVGGNGQGPTGSRYSLLSQATVSGSRKNGASVTNLREHYAHVLVSKVSHFRQQCLSNTTLIAGNSQEDNQQPSPKGKVQRLVARRTSKQREMGGILLGSRYSLICMATYSSLNKTGKEVANLVEHDVMEELFVAPLHYGFETSSV